MDIKKVEENLAKFIYELETEDRLVRVGLKEKSESEKIYKKYKNLFTKETLDEFAGLIKKTKDAKEKDILERIFFTLAGSYVGLQTAKEEDSIKTFLSKVKVKVQGKEIPFYQIAPAISKDPVFERRETYDDAAAKIVARINPKQLQLLKSEIKLLKSLGFKGYLDFFEKEKKMDFFKFLKVCKKIEKETDKVWNKAADTVSQGVLKRAFKNIRSCHTIYLRSISMYDRYYPAEKIVPTFKKFTQDLGVSDLIASIKIDDENREKKNPRAVCYWPNPPGEIHLVIKPIGGEQDFEAMFHEGGHALHGASIDSALPFSLKTLAHSNALTESYAFLLEDLVYNPEWLATYLNVGGFMGSKIKRQADFVNLMLLRRYLGKFFYEYEMFSKGGLVRGPILYSKNLQRTTGFVYMRENWLFDMDSGFYSTNYLRAWIGASQIKDYLVKKYGKKWFMNKRAGKFLRDLWSRGVTDELEDVVTRLGYKPRDSSLLVKGYREVLS